MEPPFDAEAGVLKTIVGYTCGSMATETVPTNTFYPAEEYYQEHYNKCASPQFLSLNML